MNAKVRGFLFAFLLLTCLISMSESFGMNNIGRRSATEQVSEESFIHVQPNLNLVLFLQHKTTRSIAIQRIFGLSTELITKGELATVKRFECCRFEP